jgi:phosphatidate cytidylyltransferase
LLKTRILTALIIFPGTLAVVFLTPAWLFRLLVALFLMIGCWEFRRLADLSSPAAATLVAVQAAVLALLYSYWPVIQPHATALLIAACLAWLLMFLQLLRYRPDERPGEAYRVRGFVAALAAVTFCWFSLAWLREFPQGKLIVFQLLLIIWAADVGAYFSGKQFGRRKLAPVISPNKTWEGVYGGIVLAVAAAFLWSWWIARLDIPATALVTMAVVTTFASVGGDLFISVLKRSVGLDDTGTLFPGHGGVLDRYDSLLAGAPFFALALGLLGR